MSSWTPDPLSLRLLVAVETLGSLGQAARSQGLSQPAASKRVEHLERSLGVPLLRRSPTGSRLTREGDVVAERARRVLDALDELLEAAVLLRHASVAGLQVAASMTVAEHLMPAWIARVRDNHTGLHVGLQVANTQQVQQLVRTGNADIGFVEGPDIDAGLQSRPVATDQLVVVVSPSHPWARRRRQLGGADLQATPLVAREPGSGTRQTLDHALSGHLARPLLELGSNEAVKGAVLAGAGPAVISRLAVRVELDNQSLIELPVTDLNLARTLSAVWPTGHRLNPPSTWLLQAASAGDRSNRRHGTAPASRPTPRA